MIPFNGKIFSKKFIFEQKFINKFFFYLLIFSSLILIIFHHSFDEKIKKDVSIKKRLIKNEDANNYILDILDKTDFVYTDYIYLKYVLNSDEKSRLVICNMFQKENINHCYFNKSNNNILVTYYGDQLKQKVEDKFELEFLAKFKNIKIYKIN
jgi:hypothetical protein